MRCQTRCSRPARLCESEHLRELGVDHPRRKKPGQYPVLEPLGNDGVAHLRLRRAERHVDGFAQTFRGQAVGTRFGDDKLLEFLHRLPILGRLELTEIFFLALVLHRRVHGARFNDHDVDAK